MVFVLKTRFFASIATVGSLATKLKRRAHSELIGIDSSVLDVELCFTNIWTDKPVGDVGFAFAYFAAVAQKV